MRWFTLILSIILSYVIGMQVAQAQACDQIIYDKAYKSIILDALSKGGTTKNKEVALLKERNKLITTLRKLCKGQLSTYETGKR